VEVAAASADERRRGHDLSVSPTVQSLDLGVRWEPNAPAAVLVAHDDGGARLELRAHRADPDQRSVVLTWRGCRSTRMEAPNDEAIGGHPLFRVGLGHVLWAGEVLDSPLVAELEERNRAHVRHDERRYATLRHWILPLKEVVVEVVAEQLAVARVEAPAPTAE
jgi:hypothetical protein